MSKIIDFIVQMLPAGGIAALVSAVVVYLSKSKIDAKYDKKLEKIKAELSIQSQQIQEIFKRRLEVLPNLSKAVYRSRNTARDLLENLSYQPDLRSKIGEMAFFVTEELYDVRVLLPLELYENLHAYKSSLQKFIFDYDIMTQNTKVSPPPELIASLKTKYVRIDKLHSSILQEMQRILGVNKKV